MSNISKFNETLDKLFRESTHWIRDAVKKTSPGRPPKFTSLKVEKGIKELQEIALSILVHKVSKKEFDKIVLQKKRWHTKNKGWGRKKKIKSFDEWFSKKISYENYIYIFWSRKKCKYVGRSIAGGTRPQSHFEKYWFNGVTKINIYSTSQRRQIPKLECLAIHKFNPSENNNLPSFSKHDKPCPICKNNELIKSELKSLFKLR